MKKNEYVKCIFADNLYHILRVMRIVLVFIFMGVSGAFSNTWSQKTVFSFHFKERTIREIFVAVEEKSEFVFLFANDLARDLEQRVNVQAESSPLPAILDQALKQTNLAYQIKDRQVLITRKETPGIPAYPGGTLQPQKIRISGKVMNSQKEPLPGATVVSKANRLLGTVTDEKGNFSLQVSHSDEVLVISFIGMKTQEIKAGPGTELLEIVLGDQVTDLSEVVATGYFNRKKEDFTGSAVSISGEELKKVSPANIFQSIEAFDPSFKVQENNLLGSNPNRFPNINVRGASSIPSGSSEVLRRDNISGNVNMPTFILDGYEVSVEKIYDLDLNRIASITLLKDAAATAIYGSRASNGVLVITTVTPEEGKLRVSYNFDMMLNVPDLSSYKVLNAADKLEYERLAGLYEYNNATSQDELDELYYQKKFNVVSGVDTYWLSQPVRNIAGQKHSLYIDGGTESIRYGISLQYQNSPGVMEQSKRDRYGIGVDLSYNPSGKFLFKNMLSVSQVKSAESPFGSFSSYVRMNPYYPKTNEKGELIREIDSWTDRSGEGSSLNTQVVLNPLFEGTLNSFNESSYLEVIDAFSAEWNITSALRLRGLVSINKKISETDNFLSPLSNTYYFYSPEDLSDRGQYDYLSSDEFTVDGNVTMTYSEGFGDHFVNFALGTNIREYQYDQKSFTATGFTNDRFTAIGYAKSYKEDSSPGSGSSTERLFGSFLSLNYSYLNRYLVDLSVRADGSSKFGSENKVAPFWAAGLGWNLHQEKFLKSQDLVSLLRIRANTGLTGSVSFSPYMSNTLYEYYKSNWYSTGVGAIVNQYGNENLKWQRTRNYELGLDLGFLKDRLYFSGHYYHKLTEDMLTDITLPPSTGFQSYKENLGDMKNTGYEFNTKLTVLKTNDWTVTLTGNFTHNTNKLVKISNSLKQLNQETDDAQTSDDYKGVPLVRYNEGQSLNTIYAVRSLGIDPENGKEIFIKKDGSQTYEWNVADIVPIRDGTPALYGYFGGSIYFKGFLLNCLFSTEFGGYNYNQTLVDRVENADPRYNVDRRAMEHRWKQPGDVALYKNITDQGSTYVTERFIQKNNVLELNSLYLSYDFSGKTLEKTRMKNLRAAVTMNNVWRTSSVAVERGIDYPFARTFTFSLQTTF
ncbi:MAG: SusC/RagA family TonB-linked outer membrane protein [Prolixibacteraceae bacterium]